MKRIIWPVMIVAVCQLTAFGQEEKKPEKELKNTIHFNITNPLIFGGKSLIFGYERVLHHNQTFSVNIGTTGFPSLNIVNSDSIKVNTVRDESGFNISADYRFYLSNENKFAAPRGVYVGPYYSYNYFDKKHSWSFTSSSGGTSDVESDLSLSIHTVGVELGYQFILWKRLAIDMILLGPGVGGYNLKASLGSNLSDEDQEKFFDKLNAALADKFPGYSVAVDEGEFQKTGSTKTTSLGYRYMIQIGFRF